MKCIKNIIYILISFQLILLFGCNDDVFVEELIVPVSELNLSGNGDSVEIKIKSSEWMVMSVENVNSDDPQDFIGKVYDENGALIYDYNVSFYSYSLKRGRLEFDDELNGFTISRCDNKLVVKVNENLSKHNFEFFIHISNQYKTYSIKVTQTPATELEFDNITYSYIPNSYETSFKSKIYLTVINSTEEALCVKVPIQEEIKRIYCFSDKTRSFFSKLFFSDSISVPKAFINNEIVVGNDKLLFNANNQYLPFDFKNNFKDISIKKGSYIIYIFYDCYLFRANYKMCFRNKKNGRLRYIYGDIGMLIPIDDIFVVDDKLQDL